MSSRTADSWSPTHCWSIVRFCRRRTRHSRPPKVCTDCGGSCGTASSWAEVDPTGAAISSRRTSRRWRSVRTPPKMILLSHIVCSSLWQGKGQCKDHGCSQQWDQRVDLLPQLVCPSPKWNLTMSSIQNASQRHRLVYWSHEPWLEHSFWHTINEIVEVAIDSSNGHNLPNVSIDMTWGEIRLESVFSFCFNSLATFLPETRLLVLALTTKNTRITLERQI